MNILKTHKPHRLLILFVATMLPTMTLANESTVRPELTLKEFIQRATTSDTNFEAILISQLPLRYQHDILLPDSDVIFDVKYQHNFYLTQNRNSPESVLSLSKLFPGSGTNVSFSYNKSSSVNQNNDSSLQLLISQPIAKNAFGHNSHLLDNIITIKNDVSRYQIIEAYEDYLASLTAAYYNWYSAYENLKVGQASYNSNQKLMTNILERQRQKIALPIDVNKMKLLLVGKKENLVVLQEIYDTLSNLIYRAIGNNTTKYYIPSKPDSPAIEIKFDRDYEDFTRNSRTYKMLNMLEQQGTLEVKKAADDLLPSTNLLLGYKLEGKDWGINQQQKNYFAGISLRWPIGRTVDKAKYQVSQIEYKKTVLSNQNKYDELQTNLKNIYLQINREQELILMSQQKIKLAEDILRDETENYSFGKVTLNDYIYAVNQVDENKFSNTEHQVQLNKLLLEWLRLTDKLVSKNILNAENS